MMAQRVLARFQGELTPTIKKLIQTHGQIQAWLRKFPLREAMKGAKKGWVWQEPFVPFFEAYQPYQDQLYDLNRDLDVEEDPKAIQAARTTIEPPKAAQIDQAIRTIEFEDNRIIYPKANLEKWHSKFSTWNAKSLKVLSNLV